MMFVTLLLFLFGLSGRIDRWESFILLSLLVAYILFSVYQARNGKDRKHTEEEGNKPPMKWWLAVLLFGFSCVGLAFGADLLVENAARLAEVFHISERVIAVSMVAVGTSLPELATSVIAAFKKETDIAVGNIIGSNIMNIVAVLGISGSIAPITVSKDYLHFDFLWMIGAALLLLVFMLPARNGKLTRWEGAVMLCFYLCYLYLVF